MYERVGVYAANPFAMEGVYRCDMQGEGMLDAVNYAVNLA